MDAPNVLSPVQRQKLAVNAGVQGELLMTIREKEIIEIASKLLAGMLANPHIYTAISDEEGQGQQESFMIATAVTMADRLIRKVQQM